MLPAPLPRLVLLCFLLLTAEAQAQEALAVHGFARTYAAARMQPDHAWLAGRVWVRLDGTVAYERGRIFLSNDLISRFAPPPVEGAGQVEYDLREAYLDVFFNAVDVRLGKQQIVWGEADGAFITDILSPLDLSEFTTQRFEDIREGIPALKVTGYTSPFTVTGVLVPGRFASKLPYEDSPWFVTPGQVAGIPVVLREEEPPEAKLAHGEAAVRIQFDGFPLTTLAGIYGYVWNRMPRFQKRLVTLPILQFEIPVRVDVTPVAYRRHFAGLTASTAYFEPFVFRAEAAYSSQQAFDLAVDVPPSFTDPTAPADPEREARFAEARAAGFLTFRPSLDAMIGAERGFGNHLFRAQALGSYIFDDADPLAADRFEPAFTAFWNGRFRRDTITGQVLGLATPGGEYWLDAALTYNVRDALNATLGLQLFGGDATDAGASTLGFGLYDHNDFLYLRVQYDF